MADLTRRQALVLAALSGASLAGPASVGTALAGRDKDDTLPGLQVIRSRGGVLEATLVATTAPAKLMGITTEGLYTYDGRFIGPYLVADPGDKIRLTVVNKTPIDINTQIGRAHV